jgi:poly(A) polymerase Pap1
MDDAIYLFHRLLYILAFLYRYLGVTRPISTEESNEREKEVTITLAEELKRRGTIESEEDSKTR